MYYLIILEGNLKNVTMKKCKDNFNYQVINQKQIMSGIITYT